MFLRFAEECLDNVSGQPMARLRLPARRASGTTAEDISSRSEEANASERGRDKLPAANLVLEDRSFLTRNVSLRCCRYCFYAVRLVEGSHSYRRLKRIDWSNTRKLAKRFQR